MDTNTFDVIVIGAGPAGIMAAGISASRGFRTALLEKNDLIGRKLKLTGGGRCNVTTDVPLNDFLNAFGRDGRFLRQAVIAFGPEQLKEFLTEIGMAVYQEGRQVYIHGGGRKLAEGLNDYLRRRGVKILYNQRVTHVQPLAEGLFEVAASDNRWLARRKVIVTTGGQSYPATGSSGDGFTLARELGHHIVEPVPAMASLRLKENLFAGLAGISLDEVMVEVYLDGKREGKFTGGFLITHQGISGPAVLNASLAIARGRQKGKSAAVRVHLLPGGVIQDIDAMDRLPQRLRDRLLQQAGVDTGVKNPQITRTQRHAVLEMLNGVKLEVAGTESWEQAMVTAGGVTLREVDPQTMESTRVKGLYFAGEVLDLAGECGGYNIQAAFSTGYLAGISG